MAQWIDLQQAAQLVTDKSSLALGGMTVYRRPVAFVLEVLRRAERPRDLSLICFTAGYESDLLVGAGCVGEVHTAYFGLESFGLAPMFTEKANRGELRVVEETELSLAMGIRAQAAKVAHMPSKAWIGTDLPTLRPDVKQISDPYTGEPLMAFPAIHVDVAVIHAAEGDEHGNIKFNLNLGVDVELVYIADIVIVTCERRVSQVERSNDGFIIPAPGAHYLVHAPNGAFPTSCYPEYLLNGGELMRYVDSCNAGRFDSYLETMLANGHTRSL